MKSVVSRVVFVACIGIPTIAFAYGENGDINIPYGSRAIHLLVNEARTAPHEALANCGSNCPEGVTTCFKSALPPVYLHDGLTKAAQFYADFSAYANCLQHDTPCTLVSSIASDYPATCDGNPSCACTSHKATCKSTGGTSWSNRISMFSKTHGSSSENIGYMGNGSANFPNGPLDKFNNWLLEKGTNKKCEFDSSNGHRFNILSESNVSLGVGYSIKKGSSFYNLYGVQDFGSKYSGEKPSLTAGSHYNADKKLYFKTHYYSTVEAKQVVIAINGKCTDLSLTRGTAKNGIYGTSNIAQPPKCTPYFYEAIDSKGKVTRYPTTGSLLFSIDTADLNCDKSWQKESEIATCLGTPTCSDGQHVYGNTCEADSIENCGAHGIVCTIENADSMACTNGACTVTKCQAGYHIYNNICQPDDINNCGAHENACSADNASEIACQDGLCVVLSCEAGFHLYENTCEADDIDNCGAHENVCSADGATEVTCQDAQCTIVACEEGKQLENNQCVDAGSPDNPTPEDPDNPTPEDPDNPTPEDPDNPTPDNPDNPTPEDPDNPTPDNPDNPSPEDSDGSSQSSSDSDCSSAPLMNTHTSPFWFLLGLFGLGIARRRRDD